MTDEELASNASRMRETKNLILWKVGNAKACAAVFCRDIEKAQGDVSRILRCIDVMMGSLENTARAVEHYNGCIMLLEELEIRDRYLKDMHQKEAKK